MAYSNFTAESLSQKFGINYQARNLFEDVVSVAPSSWLLETLKKAKELGYATEKSRSERLVTPILLELSDTNNHCFSVYSGMNLDVNEQLGLNGECDFIFSFSRIQDFITAPIFCITEAKKQDLEQGTIQCAAQLIAAQKFNELEGNNIKELYGCCTTGVEWRFFKLHNTTLIIDEERYLINELGKILGIIQKIINESKIQYGA